ncbi:hypothetical protein BH11PSE8_BH11PSE8_46370 [soil metagenome]
MVTATRLTNDRSTRLWLALGCGWLAYWLLMLLVGLQEYRRGGGHRLWEPVVDYGTAALVATLVAAIELRRARRHETLLDRPWQWLWRVAAWLPLTAVGFVMSIYAMRHAIYALAGHPYRHGPWADVIVYEGVKFAIFYGLFLGVHFGLRSYRAWHAERLRTEHQARLAQEARLAQLTQQLQPHFLFNALNTISSLIHTDPDLADTLLTRLATLLRAATDASHRPTQPLADELLLLEAYAQIMTERFADKASLSWDIEPRARACAVPTLGLQPLLENCFHHVVERRLAATHMVVRAQLLEGARLRIEVEDDGDLRGEAPVYGVGLSNLALRLQTLHGDGPDRASLALLPRPGGGLVVRLELPCVC